jgi:hypothetical protein
MNLIWLTKLFLSHLLTDFVFHPAKWIEDRNKRHFSSPYLYIHALLTALLAWVFIGWQYWNIALVIFVTHFFIDAWKSYQRPEVKFFLIDQFLHLLVILGSWYFIFCKTFDIRNTWEGITNSEHFWIILTAFIFLSLPTSIFIGHATKNWRDKIPDVNTESLASAGKWIGIIERTIILILVLVSQYEAIGLIVAAKALLRFNENNRPEIKTEYLLIGTLISTGIAIATGIILVKFIL